MVTNFFANAAIESSDALLERLRVVTAGLYDVAGEIGRGGMAVVYIATDMRLGRKVAIKVMEPRLSFTPGMAERFLQEARIAARLQHHNIIVVHEVQQDAELIFFVMRLVEGGSLDEICRRLARHEQKVPLDQAQWILWQSARALAYAHSEGIIHRDVKPANILVTTKGEVVVTDFGIAKAADAEGLTKSGMAIGTPVYMSPEQFTGSEAVSGAADQYALGIAAYELIAGAPPFSGDLYRLIAAHGQTVPPDVRELRPECPAPLAEAINRMLAKKPADRWPSLEAVLPVLGSGLQIDGSSTRAELATIATELQQARAESVAAWGAMAPTTPPWTSGSARRTGPVAAAISISPPNARVLVGARLDLRAVVRSDSGSTMGDVPVTWSSANPAVASVTSEGIVTAVGVGETTIRAEVSSGRGGSTGSVQAVVDVQVAAAAAARVRIVQGEQSLECGEAMQLTAEAFDTQGAPMPTSSVMWRSSHPEVLHVDARGTIMALAGGVATVSAHLGDVQGTTRVEVREAPVGAVTLTLSESTVDEGARVAITLAVTDVSGLPRSSNGLAVVTDAAEVATVETDPLALVTHAAGRVRVRVVSDIERGGSVSSVREPWAVETVEVRPVIASVFALARTTQLTVGSETTARAQAQDRRGVAIDGVPVTWSSSNPRVLTVSASGAVQAVSVGTATLTAAAGDVQSSIEMVVQAVPLAALRLDGPSDGTTFVGGSVTYGVSGTDANGSTVVPSVHWSVEPASAGRVSSNGVVEPSAVGRLTVIASAVANPTPASASSSGAVPVSRIEARAVLEVRAPRVTGVQLSQSAVALRVGDTQMLAAELVTEAGLRAADQVAWTSADESIAQVSSTGELSAVAEGSTTVTARVGAHEASASVDVVAARSGRMWGLGAAALVAAAVLVVVLAQRDRTDGAEAAFGVTSDTLGGGVASGSGGLGGVGNPTVSNGAPPAGTALAGGADAAPPASGADAPNATAAGVTGSGATGSGATGSGATGSGASGSGVTSADANRRPANAERQPTAGGSNGTGQPASLPPGRTTTAPSTPGAASGAANRPTPSVTAAASGASGTTAAGSVPPASGSTPPPPPAAEPVVVRGPNESDMNSLAFEYTARLARGDFRTGELASFFSRTTSEHRATMVGGARRVSAQADALQVDVTVELERTMGSGAIQRRYSTVRLLLRGGPGAAVIETATASALRNAP